MPVANFKAGCDIPSDIFVTDTTLRDGQQSMKAFTPAQSIRIYKFLNEIDNGTGAIRQTEFFPYTETDRKALKQALELGYEFPQVTTWIRAHEGDFKIIKDFGIRETGMLMSCSDYHIFKKLRSTRGETMKNFLDIAEMSLKAGIQPRCHLEDVTRADLDGFVVPLVKNLKDLCGEYGFKVKIRACDTLGVGLPYESALLPRSVSAIMDKLRGECGIESGQLEWHGHNDFHFGVANSVAAWIHGCGGISSTLLGIGERCGNTSLEAMLALLCQMKGMDNLKLEVLNDVVDFFATELDFHVHEKYPIMGADFNTTKAGIHADGVLKDPEIYNSFNTEKILDRPILVMVNQTSGAAGVAAWVNIYFKLKDDEAMSKRDERVTAIKNEIDNEYASGRTDAITNEELFVYVEKFIPELAADHKKETARITRSSDI